MFFLYHHNDLERLAELFEALRSRYPVAPLSPDTVLVPNAGIGRWLRIRLAESEGIAANLHEQLTGEFIWHLLRTTHVDAEAGDHFDGDSLPWHLYVALPAMARDIPEVGAYLGEPQDEVRRYQLAHRLADVFDQYMIYRGDTLIRWEQGETPEHGAGRWQAAVWRWLTQPERLGGRHRSRLLRDFVARLRKHNDNTWIDQVLSFCPHQLYCFGLLAVPPDHLRLLYALAEHIDVHFLLPNPSAAYWGDITGGRPPLELPAVEAGAEPLPGEAAVAAEHPLLGSLGRMARDTLRVLYADEFAGMVEPELGRAMAYEPPGDDTLLHRIQSDIIRLDCSDSPQGMAEDDTSFEVHACHSPLRETQVLQDQILDRLAHDDARVAAGEIGTDERLAPRDIIVMLPDMVAYAPAITAVFGGAAADRYLPFGLADRARSATHPIVTSVAALLDLPLWRWSAGELLDLLAVPAVMHRFGLSAADLDTITGWVEEAGIRWGRDGAHRAGLGAGAYEQNTWRFGLDRLLLGVAQADEETLVDGVAPWSDLEGGATAALGKLWRFEDALARTAGTLTHAATPGQWQTRLNRLLDALLAPRPEAPDEQRAVDGLRTLLSQFDVAESRLSARPLAEDRRISWEAVRDHLRSALNSTAERQPFLAGGITFCGMVPLRAVPFRMVCVLGMNDTAFPRQDTNRAFNAMYDRPRLGDRNVRDDDRLLFLQALTAARDCFYVSHIGQDVHSGEDLPPSPTVGETLEFIRRHYFRDQDDKTFRRRLIHRQPMQPFSSRYYADDKEDPRVFTFAGEWRDATRAAVGERRLRPPLLDGTPAPLTEPIDTVDLAALKRFFDHPPKAFFRDRLKLDLDCENRRVEDSEPISLDALAKAGLRSRLFASAERQALESIRLTPSSLECARGSLPPPPLAAASYAEEAEAVNELLPVWRQWQQEGRPETLEIRLDNVAGVVVTGRVAQCWPAAIRRLRTGKLRTRYRLRYWIDYLAAVAAGHDMELRMVGFEPKSGTTPSIEYAGRLEREAAQNTLAHLVQIYLEGQTRPIFYHPELDDDYEPTQCKAFENLAFRFKSAAFDKQRHHLLGDPYFIRLLGFDDAPLGENSPENPFLRAIENISEPMNAVIKPVVRGFGNKA